jgi:hypothetical protein
VRHRTKFIDGKQGSHIRSVLDADLGPFQFGANHILSPDIAGWSAVDAMKAVSRRSAVGLDGSAHYMGSTTTTLELGKILIVTPVAVADLNPLSKALNTELDGILGQDVLSQFSRVTIDYKKKQLILEK